MIQVFTNHNFNDVHAYLIHNEKKEGILIDTAYGLSDEINKFIKDRAITLTDIFITHTHFDHITGINEIFDANNSPVVHVGSVEMLGLFDPQKNNSILYGINSKPFVAKPISNLRVFQGGENIKVNGFEIEVIKIGGHSPGMLMFDFKNLKSLFTADLVYYNSFSMAARELGSDMDELAESIKTIITKYPKGYSLYPGHYQYGFTIRDVIETNTRLKKFLLEK